MLITKGLWMIDGVHGSYLMIHGTYTHLLEYKILIIDYKL
jgi:hypothetical protein